MIRALLAVGVVGAMNYWFVPVVLPRLVLVLARRWPDRRALPVITLVVANLLLAALVVALSGIGWADLGPVPTLPSLLEGASLGLGVATVQGLCGALLAAFRVTTAEPPGHGRTLNWMDLPFRLFTVLPGYAAAALLVVQMTIEEVVFRTIALGSLAELGLGWALLVSALAQLGGAAGGASWRSMAMPATAALVIAVVHGLLFWQVHELWPLVLSRVACVCMARFMISRQMRRQQVKSA